MCLGRAPVLMCSWWFVVWRAAQRELYWPRKRRNPSREEMQICSLKRYVMTWLEIEMLHYCVMHNVARKHFRVCRTHTIEIVVSVCGALRVVCWFFLACLKWNCAQVVDTSASLSIAQSSQSETLTRIHARTHRHRHRDSQKHAHAHLHTGSKRI